jgi:hypothetical protein
MSSTPGALRRVQWLLMVRTEAKRAKRNVSFSPDDQKTTLCYSSDDDEPHLAVDVDDDQPESLLAKAKVCARSHAQCAAWRRVNDIVEQSASCTKHT